VEGPSSSGLNLPDHLAENAGSVWTDPTLSGDAAVEAFRDFYTDPVTVNEARSPWPTSRSGPRLCGRASGQETDFVIFP
jgi:hypothetical protein